MKLNFFKKIFRLPSFISLPSAGIEICNDSIKYVEFIEKKGTFQLKNYGEVFIPQGIIKDGEIIEKGSLIKALESVRKRITSDFVRVAIPDEKTYIFQTHIPKEAVSNIRDTLEFKIEENIPLKLEETSFEYDILVNPKSKNTKDIPVNVSAVAQKTILDFTDVLNQAGLYPSSFELESKMLVSTAIKKGNNNNFIIVNIKDDTTVFVGVIAGVVRMTSSVAVGENMIREHLLKTGLFSDELINGKIFENDFSFENTYSRESYDLLINIFSVLKDELEKFSDYMKKEFEIKDIKNIILCGKSAVLPGLTKHINQKLNANISLVDSWVNVFDLKEIHPNMKFSDSLSFVVPIGLWLSLNKELHA
jgi:type IV pilus assembly protein PilM